MYVGVGTWHEVCFNYRILLVFKSTEYKKMQKKNRRFIEVKLAYETVIN